MKKAGLEFLKGVYINKLNCLIRSNKKTHTVNIASSLWNPNILRFSKDFISVASWLFSQTNKHPCFKRNAASPQFVCVTRWNVVEVGGWSRDARLGLATVKPRGGASCRRVISGQDWSWIPCSGRYPALFLFRRLIGDWWNCCAWGIHVFS